MLYKIIYSIKLDFLWTITLFLCDAITLTGNPLWLQEALLLKSETRQEPTSANRAKPGLTSTIEKAACIHDTLMLLLSKTVQLKVENSAQTTFSLSPDRYLAGRSINDDGKVTLTPRPNDIKLFTSVICECSK